jgi:alcohol dehydrogenase
MWRRSNIKEGRHVGLDFYDLLIEDLHLERLWSQNITITTRLVDTATIPMLFKTVQGGKIDPKLLITHRFNFDGILDAYDTFGRAASTRALKVIIAT